MSYYTHTCYSEMESQGPETKILKPIIKHQQNMNKVVQTYVKHKQHETKALTPHVKHELNETNAYTPCKTRASCT